MTRYTYIGGWVLCAMAVFSHGWQRAAMADLVGIDGGAPAIQGRLLLPEGEGTAAGWIVAVETATVPAEDTPLEEWPRIFAEGALTDYTEAEAAADGSFELRALPAGTYALDVRRPGERKAWCTLPDVVVRGDGVTDVGPIRVPSIGWEYLFDGETLGDWAEAEFYGKGEVRIADGAIVLAQGNDMTGIVWAGDLLRTGYELSLQARRVEGSDFFCGLTFPVDDACCSLILGGWGGSVVGISSLDWMDASENETSRSIRFENGIWYRVRVRVTDGHIQAWLDDKQIVDVRTMNRRVSTRWEMAKCEPLGIATWRTTGAVRDIRRMAVSE